MRAGAYGVDHDREPGAFPQVDHPAGLAVAERQGHVRKAFVTWLEGAQPGDHRGPGAVITPELMLEVGELKPGR